MVENRDIFCCMGVSEAQIKKSPTMCPVHIPGYSDAMSSAILNHQGTQKELSATLGRIARDEMHELERRLAETERENALEFLERGKPASKSSQAIRNFFTGKPTYIVPTGAGEDYNLFRAYARPYEGKVRVQMEIGRAH